MPQEQITVIPKNRKAWRNWLEKNYDSNQSIWLVYYKNLPAKSTLTYTEAVEEALCFGWIDSKTQRIDEEKYRQTFSKRKLKTVWSKVNKAKVETLIANGLMAEPGLKAIDYAKKNGSWNILDDAEALVIPPDLEKSLKRKTAAWEYFSALSRSDKRNMLQWLILAKKEETRIKRIQLITDEALQKRKPMPFR